MPTAWSSSQPRRVQWYSQDRDAYIYQSSALSSDDEDEEYKCENATRVRSTRHRLVPRENLSYKMDGARSPSACQHYTASRPHPTSKLCRCRRQSAAVDHSLSPSRPEGYDEVFVTTMDEDDQQMFIALFFWRRKVVQAHFSAWKWVVFTLRRSTRQPRRHRIETRPSKVVPIDDEFVRLHQPRPNLLLKRSSADELDKARIGYSGGKPEQVHNQRSQDNSLADRMSRPPASPDKAVLLEGHSNDTRRQFRANLRLIYVCFGQWKVHLDDSRKKREHQLAVATEFRCRHQLRTSFHIWTYCSNVRKHKIKRHRIADRYNWTIIKHKFFSQWKRHYRTEREISRRQMSRDNRQKRSVFQHWCRCILKTRQCRAYAVKRCHNLLQVAFSTYLRGLLIAKEELWTRDVATSHYQQKLQVSVIRQWKQAVFESPFYLLTVDRGKQISLSTGIRMWKRFIDGRQQSAQKYLLADYFRYRAFLRHAVDGWRRFLLRKQQFKQVDDEARDHYERNLKLAVLRQLRSAGYLNRACRSQIKLATRWHEQKRLTRLFELWIVRVRHGTRLRQFQLAIHKRKLNDAICTWQGYTTTSKTLESKRYHVSKRSDELLLKVAMDKWAKMLHIKIFIFSLKVKRQHASFAHHFRAWHKWADKKVSCRKAVEKHLHQHQTTLLQRIVSQWLGVALRKRCFQRLVKLFRKKQTRQRTKSVLRLVHLHALCCKHARKFHHKQRQSSFLGWKHIYRESKEKRMALAVAAQYFSFRRYVMAIKQWSTVTDRIIRARHTEGKALSHYFRQISRSALHYWYIAVRNRRRQKEFLSYRQQLREDQTKTRLMHTWYILVRQRAQYRTQKWAALRFRGKRLQRRLFCAWKGYLGVCRLTKESGILAVTTYKNGICTKILYAWRRAAKRSAQRKSNCLFARNFAKQRQLLTSMSRWRTYHYERQRRRDLLAKANKFHDEYLLCLVMFRWQDMWFKTSALRSKEIRATQHINNNRLAKTMSRWRTNHRYSSRIRAQIVKTSTLYKTGLLSKHFHAWKRYRYVAHYKAVKRRQAARQFHQNLLSGVFKAWRRYSDGKSFGRWKRKYVFEHRTTAILRLSFRRWKCHRNKHTLNRVAKANHAKRLLQKTWIGWRSHCEFVTKVRKKILVTHQLLRYNLFRTTFIQWKAYASSRQKRYSLLVRAGDHHTKWLYKQAVACLRKWTQFQQTAVRAMTLARVNGAKNLLNRWKHFVIATRAKRSRYSLAGHTHLLRCQTKHFLAWRLLTKRCVHEHKNKSDALYRVTCLRMVWIRWRRVIEWKHCILAMSCRQIAYLRVDMWRRWRTYAQKCIEYKVKAVRAMAFQRIRLRAKIWRSWLEYIANRHEKQQQLVWVLSYYSVEVLQRQSLASWKKLVAIQRAKRETAQLAEWFNARRLEQEGYRRLKAYVELRKQKLERTEAQLLKAEKFVLSRSVRKWKRQTSIWHQKHCYKTLATQTFIKRRLKHGLDGLLTWRVSRRETRALIIQAERFRDEHAVLARFRCWQRYHQWRVKHAHLTRVFKRNQKGNVFARWKTYWQNRQVAHERRLQARVFHCVHTEQHVLDTWKTFVCLHKQKKKACAFDTSRTLQQACTHWKRRVHALQRIRKMLRYQESLCAQMHFGAWKRYAIARKQLDARVRSAMKFKDNLCKQDVWQKWCVWIHLQQQERETIVLAVRFRQRLFSRKSFVLWRERACFWKRKRILGRRALLNYQSRLLFQVFHALVDRRRTAMGLMKRQNMLSAQLVVKRKRRVIRNFRLLCARREYKQSMVTRSYRHWKLSYQRKHLDRMLQWYTVAKHRKLQYAQAAAFARMHALKQCFDILSAHKVHMKQIQRKISAFRRRYFRSVADDCFYQWRSFATFKLKLRALSRKTRQSRRRQRLLQWRSITVEQARRREGVQNIAAKRRHRELMARFIHWESVCTDLWIEKELASHHQRHAQKHRMLRSAIRIWRLQLSFRQERHRCRQFFLERHRAWLVQVLQQWRWANLSNSTCDV